MAMEHAESFVEKFFTNDEFIKEVVRRRGFSKYEHSSDEIENEKLVHIANEMGFKFDVEEYKTASMNYMNSLGGWEAAKAICHMLKVAIRLRDEND